MPMRGKMHVQIAIRVCIDQAGQCGEWQFWSIHRMGKQQRIARRGFYRPEIVELDNKPVFFMVGRADHLTGIVESDWRADRRVGNVYGRIEIPGKFALIYLDVARQWNEEAVRHRIDEWRAALDRLCVVVRNRIVGLLRQCLEPRREPFYRRDWQRQYGNQFRGTAKG